VRHGIVTEKTERKGLSVAEVAKEFGLSVGFVRKEIKRGRLVASKLGRRLVVPIEFVTEWVEEGLIANTEKEAAVGRRQAE
jgi:excisionase family DNA binding protein